MEERVTADEPKAIGRLVVDATLYGLSKSLDFLKDEKRMVTRRIGDLMLQYLIDVGSVSSPDEPDRFAQSLSILLTRNGFSPEIPMQFEGTPPRPSFPDFIDYLRSPVGRDVRGGEASLPEKSDGGDRVDWVLYEMLLYGMTKALDELGVQAQLILDRMGSEMTDYLVDAGAIQPSKDPAEFSRRVSDFFMREGYAGGYESELEGSPPHSFVSRYRYAPYYDNVLSRLQNEGSALFSCPMCLVGESIYVKAQGLKFQNLVEFRFLPGRRVSVRTRIYPPTERFNEGEAERVSKMMG